MESLFSAIGQLNGSNDLTDAYAALSASRKILTTGIIHSSGGGNVGGVMAPLGEVSALPVEPVKQVAASHKHPEAPARSFAYTGALPMYMHQIITQLELKHNIKCSVMDRKRERRKAK